MDTPSPEWISIVGVVPNVKQNGQRNAEPDAVVYVPLRSNPQRTPTLFVRTAPAPPWCCLRFARRCALSSQICPLFNVRDDGCAAGAGPVAVSSVFGSMFAVFAAIALMLSALGLFSVTTYSVTQRTQEIGVRMALGAQPRSILWLVLRRALIQLAIGLPLGLAGAYGVGRLLQSIVVQTGVRGDIITLGLIVVILIVVAVCACLWPARRAANLDPLLALRGD